MEFAKSARLLREANVRLLAELARKDPRIVLLDADLMNASAFSLFQKELPDRAFNCGIQESNMIGVAGGMASVGLIPVAHTFACFAGRRVADQVFMSGVYARQNIKLFGTDPGAANAGNGGTHMALEDVGIMRSMPGISIVSPTDETMLQSILPQILYTAGVFYVRLVRKTNLLVYGPGTAFTLGKAHVARQGRDITLIAEGSLMVPEALKAAELLAADGLQARVVDMFTIKPLDREAVAEAAAETGAVLTVENHNIYNGLGSAVAEVLAENRLNIPFERAGFPDTVGETATPAYLLEKYSLSAAHLYERARRLIRRKYSPMGGMENGMFVGRRSGDL